MSERDVKLFQAIMSVMLHDVPDDGTTSDLDHWLGSDLGATFRNASGAHATFEFAAKGEWSFAPAAGMLGPGRAHAPLGPNSILPGAHSFALVARRDDGTIEFAGDRDSVSLKANETI